MPARLRQNSRNDKGLARSSSQKVIWPRSTLVIQEKPQSGDPKAAESRTRKLAYTPEFKKDLPRGAIKKFLELTPSLEEPGDSIREKNIEITLINKIVGYSQIAKYYKVVIEGSSYFVKDLPDEEFGRKGGGLREVAALQEAQRILKEKNIDWAEVVDFKLGYKDERTTFFVSKWDDRLLLTFSDYLGKLELESEERKNLLLKYEQLLKILPNFSDLAGYNMAYDPVTKKFILFDLMVSVP